MACNLHSLCGPPTMDMGEGRSLPPTSLPPVYGGWWITDVNPADCTSVQERYNPLVSVFPFPVGTGHHGSRPSRYTVPRTPPDLLERPRLLEFLQRHLNRKLILVCASPGYGKTALAVNFAHQADFPLAWLSLDETDRDIVTIVLPLLDEFEGCRSDEPESNLYIRALTPVTLEGGREAARGGVVQGRSDHSPGERVPRTAGHHRSDLCRVG